MNLRQLQTEAHAIAVAKGWYDNEPTFGDRISLIHSELSEALEAYRERGLESWIQMGWANYANTIPDDKPEGVASELADVVIRVADMAEHYGVWVDAAYQRVSVRAYPIPQLETFGEWVTYKTPGHPRRPRNTGKHGQRVKTTFPIGRMPSGKSFEGWFAWAPTTASIWTAPSRRRWGTTAPAPTDTVGRRDDSGSSNRGQRPEASRCLICDVPLGSLHDGQIAGSR